MFVILDIFLLSVFGLFLCYLAFLSVLALIARRHMDFSTQRMRKFAVVIPAHNEELTISKTVQSAYGLDYPRKFFDVVVIADNCTDQTPMIARTLNAIVYERTNSELRGKGYALRWCFDKLIGHPRAYDAVVVVDADSTFSPNFLRVMNWYLSQGARVIQAADLVQPQPGAWSPEITRLGLTLYNFARPLGRKVLGFSAGLRGNGMCFSVETLRQVPWRAYSLTEDLEYGLQLLLQDISVSFAPEATVYAAMPQESKHAVTQRARWETGRMPIVRTYASKLLKAAFRRRSFRFIDALIDLCTPPLVNMIAVVALITALHGAAVIMGGNDAGTLAVYWMALGCTGILHVVVGLVAARADSSLYKALVYVPWYALWKATVYAKLLLKGKPEQWVRTTREQIRNASTTT